MNKREIIYSVDHLDLFNMKEGEDIELLKDLTVQNTEAITILLDDVPIISIGLRLINGITGEVWMIKSENISKHLIYIIKRLNELIYFYAEKYKLQRIHTFILEENIKWIENLGFEKETELIGFLKDKKSYLYRRLFKWE